MNKPQQRWKLILNIITLTALVVLIYAVRDQIASTISDLTRVDYWILPIIIIWQALNYHSYAELYRYLFRILGERIRYRPLVRVQFELNFVNNVFPSGGVSGISYFALRMRDADVPASKSTIVQIAKFISIFVSFLILMAAGLIMLAFGGDVNNFTILVAGSFFTLVIVATFGLGFIIGSKKRINSFFTYITKVINRLIHVFRPHYPETINIERARGLFDDLHENYLVLKSDYKALIKPLTYALLCNIAEIMTIYTVYIAFGQWINPGAVILAYAVASFSGILSILPGGVGVYEATMTAVLAAAGVPAGVSIPVTIMYRILNMLIQLPPGYYLYYKNLHRPKIQTS
jgi:uncharacterized protein (TIRG00374 family)